MTDFPNIARLGLKVFTDSSYPMDYIVDAPNLERLLSEAPVVNLVKINEHTYETSALAEYTHTCLAIGIQPIVKDTAESLLRSFVEIETRKKEKYYVASEHIENIFERAKRLLEGK